MGDKADPSLRAEVETVLSEIKSALEGEDEALIKEKTEQLSTVMMKLGEAAYSTETPETTQENTSEKGAEAAAEDVVDAEFEEIDDNNQEDEEDIKKAN